MLHDLHRYLRCQPRQGNRRLLREAAFKTEREAAVREDFDARRTNAGDVYDHVGEDGALYGCKRSDKTVWSLDHLSRSAATLSTDRTCPSNPIRVLARRQPSDNSCPPPATPLPTESPRETATCWFCSALTCALIMTSSLVGQRPIYFVQSSKSKPDTEKAWEKYASAPDDASIPRGQKLRVDFY